MKEAVIPCRCKSEKCRLVLYVRAIEGGGIYLRIHQIRQKRVDDIFLDKEGIKQLLKILQEG